MTSKKYESARRALYHAKSTYLGSKGDMERYIKEMEIASLMPANVLKNHIWRVYQDNEPKRVKEYLEVAFRNARGNSITNKSMIESWLGYAKEHSDKPLERKIVDDIWEVYKQNEPRRKYECLKVALRNARGNSITDKSMIESWLGYAKEHSAIPLSQNVINKIWDIYKKNEPVRAEECLETVRMFASKNSINDKSLVESWLEYAERHLSKPIDKEIVDNIWNIYRENEPRRAEECFATALRYANEREKCFMKDWLNYADGHSHGFLNRAKFAVRKFLIKRRFALAQDAKTRLTKAVCFA